MASLFYGDPIQIFVIIEIINSVTLWTFVSKYSRIIMNLVKAFPILNNFKATWILLLYQFVDLLSFRFKYNSIKFCHFLKLILIFILDPLSMFECKDNNVPKTKFMLILTECNEYSMFLVLVNTHKNYSPTLKYI